MSIRTKVIGCFVLILFVFLGVSVHNYFRFRQANSRLALVNDVFLPFSRLVVQLQANIYNATEEMRRVSFQAETSIDGSGISRMVRDLHPYLINKKILAAEQMLAKQESGQLKPLSGELTGRLGKVRDTFEKLVSTKDRGQFENLYLELRWELQSVLKRVDEECQRITLAAQSEGKENLLASVFLCLFVLLFGSFTVLLSHRVLQPLPLLINSIRKIANGDFNQSLKVNVSNKDEISILTREYNRMLAGLMDRDKKIRLQQAELLKSERLAAIGQLSAEVVHEIRNPLNAISLNIDWLENELRHDGVEVSRTLKSISKEIERLNQITESYLVRARVRHEENEKTPVHDLINEILEFSKEEDRARNISVVTSLADGEIWVRTERSRLKQAFLNVMRNAREAMPRGGTLVVKSEVKENVYRIQFSDTGYGMNDATRRQTFQPFYTTKTNGTGLGLMLTKTIVEEANGSIQCESQMGTGTTFTFQFPV